MLIGYPEIIEDIITTINAAIPDKPTGEALFAKLHVLENMYAAVEERLRQEMKLVQESSTTNDAKFNEILLNAALHQDHRQTDEEARFRAYNAVYNPFHFVANNYLNEIAVVSDPWRGKDIAYIKNLM